MHAVELIEKVRRVSPAAANALFDRLIPQLIPLADGLAVRVREASDARCELSMPLNRRARDRLGAVGLGAQMTLADLTVGVALLRRFPPSLFRIRVHRAEVDFLLDAEGGLRCLFEPGAELHAALASASSAARRGEAWLPLRLLDEGARVVTEVRFLVSVTPVAEQT